MGKNITYQQSLRMRRSLVVLLFCILFLYVVGFVNAKNEDKDEDDRGGGGRGHGRGGGDGDEDGDHDDRDGDDPRGRGSGDPSAPVATVTNASDPIKDDLKAVIFVVSETGVLESCRNDAGMITCTEGEDITSLLEEKYERMTSKTGCTVDTSTFEHMCGSGDVSDFPNGLCGSGTCTNLNLTNTDECTSVQNAQYSVRFVCEEEDDDTTTNEATTKADTNAENATTTRISVLTTTPVSHTIAENATATTSPTLTTTPVSHTADSERCLTEERQCLPSFTYNGITYTNCTEVEHTQPWCYVNDTYWVNCVDCDEITDLGTTILTTTIPESGGGDEEGNKGCLPGFEMVGGTCEDKNECEPINPCSFGWCTNTPGAFECRCQTGFKWNQTRQTCVKYDYCTPGRCKDGQCVSNQGWYQCNCEKGFTFDKATDSCVDYDECATNNHFCLPTATCENLVGGYRCHCKENFKGNGITSCDIQIDVNEIMNLTCSSNRIKVSLATWIADNYPPGLHLEHESCPALRTKDADVFSIRRDLSSCGTTVNQNTSHIIYSNLITNKVQDTGGLSVGSLITIRFSCAYPSKNLEGKLEKGSEELAGSGEITIGFPDEDGKYPMTTVLPPFIPSGDKDDKEKIQEYFSKVPPKGVSNGTVPGVGGAVKPGNPFLEETTDKNGVEIIPGKNGPLPNGVMEIINGGEGIEVLSKSNVGVYAHNMSGYYNISMWPFTDDTYMTVSGKKYYYTQEPLYIRVSVHTQDRNVVLYAHTCWATRDSDKDSSPSINLVEKGCQNGDSLDDKVSLKHNGKHRNADLSFPVFMFEGKNTLFVHCLVDLCNKKTDGEEYCRADCDENKRKKRSTITVEFEKGNNLTLAFLIKEANARKPEADKGLNEKLDTSGFVIPAILFVVLAILLLIGCCLLFVFTRRRRKRRREKQQGIDEEGEQLSPSS